MPKKPLPIVPVTLHPIQNTSLPNDSSNSSGLCTIKLANAEITFQNGVEERIIQTIIKQRSSNDETGLYQCPKYLYHSQEKTICAKESMAWLR